jgi:hypothetical protein
MFFGFRHDVPAGETSSVIILKNAYIEKLLETCPALPCSGCYDWTVITWRKPLVQDKFV